MRPKQFAAPAFFFVLATIPLLFGARHPLVQGLYTVILLLSCGSWLIFNFEESRASLVRKQTLIPLAFIAFIFLTSMPLPLFLVELLSPVRAEAQHAARIFADLDTTGASLSYYAPVTRSYAIYLLTLSAAFYFATLLFIRERRRITVLWILMLVGTFEAVYGLLQAMNPALGVLWLPSALGAEGCARGTIIYRNQYAAFMNLCWPMSLVLAIILSKPVLKRHAWLRRKKEKTSLADRLSLIFQKAALPFWSAGLMILAVIFSRSRGGILVMLVMASLLLILLPFSRRIKTASGLTFLVFTLTYGGMIGFAQVTNRFLTIYEGAMGRIMLWLDSLSMLKDHLLTGIGMGAYRFLSPVYLREVPGDTWFDFAHNEYVELAIELGLPVFLLVAAWLARGMVRRGRAVKKMLDAAPGLVQVPDVTVTAVCTFVALLGFLMHGVSDFIWRLPVNAVYALTLAAMLQAAVSQGMEDELR